MKPKSIARMLAALMCGAAAAGAVLKPGDTRDCGNPDPLAPHSFGEWTALPPSGHVPNPQTKRMLDDIYAWVVERNYVNHHGDLIMLSMACGSDQRGALQAHRPEICYPAQGFTLEAKEDGTLSTSFGDIPVRRLTTSMGARHEPVTYWLTMADHVVRNDFDKRMVQFRLMLTGQIPDGILFRVSSIDRDAAHAFGLQQKFTADLLEAIGPESRRRLSGLKPAGAT